MSKSQLPPLQLNSARSVQSNESTDQTGSNVSLNVRERRRQRILEQQKLKQNEANEESNRTTQESERPRTRRSRGKELTGQTNNAFQSAESKLVI